MKLLAVSILATMLVSLAFGDDSPNDAASHAKTQLKNGTPGRIAQRPKGEWPLPGQNVRYMSQAELPCNIPHAPHEVFSYDLGRTPIGSAICADIDDDGEMEVLYGAAPLVCMSTSGKEKWRSACGGVLAIADIDEDGHTELVVGGAAGLSTPPAWIRGGKSKKEPICQSAIRGRPSHHPR